MNYAIEILEKEKSLIEKALTNWETKEYPEAKKQREKRLNELNDAIKAIDNKKYLIDTLEFIKINPVTDKFTKKLCEETLKKKL
jgi:archaellum biogenesis ATPase FlaH